MNFKQKLEEPLNHKPENRISVFHIDFTEYYYEAANMDVSGFKGIGTIKISVYDNEGPIPHFHMNSETTDFHTCVCLHVNKYFLHGNKQDTLNTSQRKTLDKFLREKTKKDGFKPGSSNWDVLCTIWNLVKDDKYKVKTKEIPDYKNMKESIKEKET